MYDVSDLKVKDILRKDFKKWMRVGLRLTFDHLTCNYTFDYLTCDYIIIVLKCFCY